MPPSRNDCCRAALFVCRPSLRNPGTSCSAVFEACDAGELNVLEYLISRGGQRGALPALLSERSSDGRSPFMAACCRGHLAIAQALFNAGARGDAWAPDPSG